MPKRRAKPPRRTYSLMDEMMASTTEPMPAEYRTHQLTRMWQGLHALETAPAPTTDDWLVCSDALNLQETLVEMGEVQDGGGTLPGAVAALAEAGKRARSGGRLGLTGAGIQAVRGLLEDYAACLNALPARTIIRCHRRTEARLQDILAGRRLPHDVEVMTA